MELDRIHQARAFGVPKGDSKPNAFRQRVLSFLQDRRRSGAKPATVGDGETWGYMPYAIPELDYYILIHRFPELASKDRETHTRAWNKFFASPLSAPYRTDDSIGRRKVNHRIIVK